MNPTLLYAEAYHLLEEGRRDEAATKLEEALETTHPNPFIRESLEQFFKPGIGLTELSTHYVSYTTLKREGVEKKTGGKTDAKSKSH